MSGPYLDKNKQGDKCFGFSPSLVYCNLFICSPDCLIYILSLFLSLSIFLSLSLSLSLFLSLSVPPALSLSISLSLSFALFLFPYSFVCLCAWVNTLFKCKCMAYPQHG